MAGLSFYLSINPMKIKEMEHYTFLSRLFDYSELKVQQSAFWAAVFGYWISVISFFSNNVLGISSGLFGMLILIMLTDYVTGLKAAKKEGEKFCSKKGLGWVFKLGSYMVFLAVSFSLQHEMTEHAQIEFMRWPMQLIHFYLLIHIFLWETKSVDENFERLGYSFRILKLIDFILKTSKSKIESKIENDGK